MRSLKPDIFIILLMAAAVCSPSIGHADDTADTQSAEYLQLIDKERELLKALGSKDALGANSAPEEEQSSDDDKSETAANPPERNRVLESIIEDQPEEEEEAPAPEAIVADKDWLTREIIEEEEKTEEMPAVQPGREALTEAKGISEDSMQAENAKITAASVKEPAVSTGTTSKPDTAAKDQRSSVATKTESKNLRQMIEEFTTGVASRSHETSTELTGENKSYEMLRKELLQTRARISELEDTIHELAALVVELKEPDSNFEPKAAYEPQPAQEESIAQDTGKVEQIAQSETASSVEPEKNLPIATIYDQWADLRTGPRRDDTVLFSLPRGTPLKVEFRMADWYRVITPDGIRAWVKGDALRFGPTPSSKPTKTVQIRAVDPELELQHQITADKDQKGKTVS
ncbi:MAG: SH3 domain-containing protein [Candidatus Dadabacteria bacterium]|nr:MAG: SH3 domain-containing protein [Candidatus Dadabacteria bacterium]